MLLMRHYLKLKSLHNFRESKLIFIGENNLGLEASHLDSMVQGIGGVEVYWQTEKKAGVCKTEAITRSYQFLLSQSLASDALKFDLQLFTVTREQDVASMLALLRDQMERFHWEKSPASTSFGTDRCKLTAKQGTGQDDLLIATMMLLHWGRLIIANRARLEN